LPNKGKNCFGISLFIREPDPPATMMAAFFIVLQKYKFKRSMKTLVFHGCKIFTLYLVNEPKFVVDGFVYKKAPYFFYDCIVEYARRRVVCTDFD
jgi:hypothetical protein